VYAINEPWWRRCHARARQDVEKVAARSIDVQTSGKLQVCAEHFAYKAARPVDTSGPVVDVVLALLA